MSERPVDIWRRKLEHLQTAEATASDPAQQFSIREQIKDAERRIADLESDSPTYRPPQSRPSQPSPFSSGGEKQLAQHAESDSVFLSHNSRDKPAVRNLKQYLLGYQITVWLGEDELQPGIPWQKLLEDGIRNSKSVAVLVGSDGLGPWEEEEMRAALQFAVSEKRSVIPVLLPGAPSQPELPMFLRNRTWVDLRDGLTAAGLDKLVWGITGKKPTKQRGPTTKPATNQSLDDVLFGYSDACVAAWNQGWTNPDDPDRLVYYVPPHYSLVKVD